MYSLSECILESGKEFFISQDTDLMFTVGVGVAGSVLDIAVLQDLDLDGGGAGGLSVHFQLGG